MFRTILIFTTFLFWGFSSTKKSIVDFLFYDIPLDKDKSIINIFLKTDQNFFPQTADSLFTKDGYKIVSVKKTRTLKEIADSATVELSHTYMTVDKGIGLHHYHLNEITLTLYFKTSSSRDYEFDTIKKILGNNYKRTNDRENPVEFEYAISRKVYPQIQLTMDKLSKTRPYFTLRYYSVDKSTSH